jgi:hypothetical protein
MCGPVVQLPGVAELQRARDRWITINSIWDMVGGREHGRHVHQPPEPNTIGLFLQAIPHAEWLLSGKVCRGNTTYETATGRA